MKLDIYRSVGKEVIVSVEDHENRRTHIFKLDGGTHDIYTYDGCKILGECYGDLGYELLLLFELEENKLKE